MFFKGETKSAGSNLFLIEVPPSTLNQISATHAITAWALSIILLIILKLAVSDKRKIN